jgi:hypothetical protein
MGPEVLRARFLYRPAFALAHFFTTKGAPARVFVIGNTDPARPGDDGGRREPCTARGGASGVEKSFVAAVILSRLLSHSIEAPEGFVRPALR